MDLDHVVLWVEDLARGVDFYEGVVGLKPLNAEKVRAGETALATLRVSASAVIDLAPKFGADFIASAFGGEGSAGNRVHHVCFSFDSGEYEALKARLKAAGVACSDPVGQSGGARGLSREAFYFRDPDGNVIEARVYG